MPEEILISLESCLIPLLNTTIVLEPCFEKTAVFEEQTELSNSPRSPCNPNLKLSPVPISSENEKLCFKVGDINVQLMGRDIPFYHGAWQLQVGNSVGYFLC